MTIQNQSGRTSYNARQGQNPVGTPAFVNLPKVRPVLNPDLAQISTVTVAGTATDGVYAFDIVDTQTGLTHTVTQTRATTPASNTDLADAFTLLVNGDSALLNIVTADNTAGVLTLTFLHNGRTYTVGNEVVTGPGTLVAADTQSPGGSALPFGRFATLTTNPGGEPIVALPDAVAEAAINGIILRSYSHANQQSPLASAVDAVQVGEMVDLAIEGGVIMENVGAAALPNGVVHVVINVAGGDQLGECRGDADGGNTVAMDATHAYWVNDTANGARDTVMIRR